MKIREDFLAYCKPCEGQEELDGVIDALKSGWWSKGPKVIEFEKKFAQSIGVKHAIALNSCTAGLFLGLMAHNVGPGDEVITTPMTFCATANTIVHCGATPVFADVDPVTGLIDPKEIEKKITPRTKGIVPVHYAGRACDMDTINAIAKATPFMMRFHNGCSLPNNPLYILIYNASFWADCCAGRPSEIAFSFFPMK